MKKIIFGLLALFAFGAAIAASERLPVGDGGASIPLFSQNNAPIYLDTLERDTSTRQLFVLNRHIRTYTDTLGTAWMRCDDSSGTDSVGGRLIWQGNPSQYGTALWENIDSVSIGPVAGGVETQTSKVVINDGRYALIRFIITQQLHFAAAQKAVCQDVRLNVPAYMAIPSN